MKVLKVEDDGTQRFREIDTADRDLLTMLRSFERILDGTVRDADAVAGGRVWPYLVTVLAALKWNVSAERERVEARLQETTGLAFNSRMPEDGDTPWEKKS